MILTGERRGVIYTFLDEWGVLTQKLFSVRATRWSHPRGNFDQWLATYDLTLRRIAHSPLSG